MKQFILMNACTSLCDSEYVACINSKTIQRLNINHTAVQVETEEPSLKAAVICNLSFANLNSQIPKQSM